jgi:hypothetical protein
MVSASLVNEIDLCARCSIGRAIDGKFDFAISL